MASRTLVLESSDAVDLVDELSLSAGDHIVSNDGTEGARIYEAAAAPADRRGHPIPPGGSWGFTVADLPQWVWAKRGVALIVSESD